MEKIDLKLLWNNGIVAISIGDFSINFNFGDKRDFTYWYDNNYTQEIWKTTYSGINKPVFYDLLIEMFPSEVVIMICAEFRNIPDEKEVTFASASSNKDGKVKGSVFVKDGGLEDSFIEERQKKFIPFFEKHFIY